MPDFIVSVVVAGVVVIPSIYNSVESLNLIYKIIKSVTKSSSLAVTK